MLNQPNNYPFHPLNPYSQSSKSREASIGNLYYTVARKLSGTTCRPAIIFNWAKDSSNTYSFMHHTTMNTDCLAGRSVPMHLFCSPTRAQSDSLYTYIHTKCTEATANSCLVRSLVLRNRANARSLVACMFVQRL